MVAKCTICRFDIFRPAATVISLRETESILRSAYNFCAAQMKSSRVLVERDWCLFDPGVALRALLVGFDFLFISPWSVPFPFELLIIQWA